MSGKAQFKLAASIAVSLVALMLVPSLPVLADGADEALGASDKEMQKAEAWFIKGHRALDKRDVRGAEACYRKAIELDPSESKFHRQLCLLLIGEGRSHDAEREALYATKVDPTDWKAYLVLGQVFHLGNRIDEEVTVYKKALAYIPKEEKNVREKVEDFIKKDEESVKKEKERLKKKKEWEEREYKDAY